MKTTFLTMIQGLYGSRKWFVGLVTIGVLAFSKRLEITIEVCAMISAVAGMLIGVEGYRDGKAAESGTLTTPPGSNPEITAKEKT